MSATLLDPLSEVSRKERRMLLGLSTLGAFFTHGGVLPTKFTALGVELNAGEQQTFLIIFAIILLYFLIAFFVYAMSDFIVWRRRITEEYIGEIKEIVNDYMHDNRPQDQYEAEVLREKEKAWRKYQIWAKLTKPMSFLRALFEFVLPIAVGCYSITTALIYAFPRT